VKKTSKQLSRDLTTSCERFFQDNRLPFIECRATHGSGRNFKPHMHRRFSVGAIAKGSARFFNSTKETVLEPGMLAIINPETLHACNTTGKCGRSYYMLHADLAWCTDIQRSLWQNDQFQPVTPSVLNNWDLFDRFCTMMDQLMDEQVFLMEKEQLAIEFLTKLFLATGETKTTQLVEEENNAEINHLKELLGKHLEQNITLDDLADELTCNPFTLLRRFKTANGLTPHQYRVNCRIEKARLLLQQGTDITETALNCGFFDQSHFHRHFKAMTTVTPREYQLNFVQ
jgi:AraC-like DNA-binding protein